MKHSQMIDYSCNFVYDKGTNLVLKNTKPQSVKANSNRLRNQEYDASGNQVNIPSEGKAWYNSQNQLLVLRKGAMIEYYTYAYSGERVKKVSLTNKGQKIIRIDIVFYVGQIEQRSCFMGSDLSYNGQDVLAKSGSLTELNNQTETRIKSGHGQLAKIIDRPNKEAPGYCYNLLNNIDNNSGVLDSEGKLKSYQAYYPYGNVLVSEGNTNNKQLGFSGQELDNSGFNYFGYRYYDGGMGRWIQPDPIGFESGQLNLYAMLNGNPVSNRDAMGLNKIKIYFLIGFLGLRKYGLDVKIDKKISDKIYGFVWSPVYNPGQKYKNLRAPNKYSVLENYTLNEIFKRSYNLGKDEAKHKKSFELWLNRFKPEDRLGKKVFPNMIKTKLSRSPSSEPSDEWVYKFGEEDEHAIDASVTSSDGEFTFSIESLDDYYRVEYGKSIGLKKETGKGLFGTVAAAFYMYGVRVKTAKSYWNFKGSMTSNTKMFLKNLKEHGQGETADEVELNLSKVPTKNWICFLEAANNTFSGKRYQKLYGFSASNIKIETHTWFQGIFIITFDSSAPKKYNRTLLEGFAREALKQNDLILLLPKACYAFCKITSPGMEDAPLSKTALKKDELLR